MPAAIPERKAALANGEKTYLGGRLCNVHGNTPRLTKSGKCVDCERDREVGRRAVKNQYFKEYYVKNKARKTAYSKDYYKDNKPVIVQKVAAYQRKRTAEDIAYALRRSVRARTSFAIRNLGAGLSQSSMNLIGCSAEALKAHLESQFLDGMNWDNRSLWHIDHITPLSSATTRQELEALCHYSNLQPLWAVDNLRKGASMPTVKPKDLYESGKEANR